MDLMIANKFAVENRSPIVVEIHPKTVIAVGLPKIVIEWEVEWELELAPMIVAVEIRLTVIEIPVQMAVEIPMRTVIANQPTIGVEIRLMTVIANQSMTVVEIPLQMVIEIRLTVIANRPMIVAVEIPPWTVIANQPMTVVEIPLQMVVEVRRSFEVRPLIAIDTREKIVFVFLKPSTIAYETTHIRGAAEARSRVMHAERHEDLKAEKKATLGAFALRVEQIRMIAIEN